MGTPKKDIKWILDRPRLSWIAIGITLVLTAIVYFPGLSGPFIFDDNTHIVSNPKIHSPQSLQDPIFNGKRQRRVLLNLSYAANGIYSGLNPRAFKITNLALHLFTILLVFLWLSQLFSSRGVALLTTTLFALHPIQTEAVTYIFGRVSLLSGLFTIFSFYLIQKSKNYPLFSLAGIFVLAILTKESSVLLLLTWTFYEAFIKKSGPSFLWSSQALVTYCLAFLYIPVHYFFTGPGFWGKSVGFDLYPYWEHLLNQLFYYFYYFQLLFFVKPHSIYHPFHEISYNLYAGAIAGLLLLSILAYSFFRNLKICSKSSFFVLLFFTSLVVTNGPLQMINPFGEYRLYMSNLALFALFGLRIQNLAIQLNFHTIKSVLFMFLLLGCCYFTHARNLSWGNGYLVYQQAADLYPNYEKTNTFAGIGCEFENDLRCAEKYYSRAAELVPKSVRPSAKPIFRLATIQAKLGYYNKALVTLDKIPIKKLRIVPRKFYILKLDLLLELKRFKETEILLEEAKKQHPKNSFNSFQSRLESQKEKSR